MSPRTKLTFVENPYFTKINALSHIPDPEGSQALQAAAVCPDGAPAGFSCLGTGICLFKPRVSVCWTTNQSYYKKKPTSVERAGDPAAVCSPTIVQQRNWNHLNGPWKQKKGNDLVQSMASEKQSCWDSCDVFRVRICFKNHITTFHQAYRPCVKLWMKYLNPSLPRNQGKFSICQNNKPLILRSLWSLDLSKYFELMGQNQAKHLAVHHSLFTPTHCQGIFPKRCEVESPAHLFPCMCLLDT